MEDLAYAIEELRLKADAIFPVRNIKEHTGGRWHWGTVQNKKYRREIPKECFAYSGRLVMVLRDPFFSWWASTLSAKRSSPLPGTFTKPSQRRGATRAQAET